MLFAMRHRRHTAHYAWALIAAFVLQTAMPLLAQAAAQDHGQGKENQITLCTMQGPKLVTLASVAGAGDTEQSEGVASPSQWCPACLLHHLAHAALPSTEGLTPFAIAQQTGWEPNTYNRVHDHTPINLALIRAPPHA